MDGCNIEKIDNERRRAEVQSLEWNNYILIIRKIDKQNKEEFHKEMDYFCSINEIPRLRIGGVIKVGQWNLTTINSK